MKLKKLSVLNFRGLKGSQNSIEFDGSEIIFLIGKNNSGKSTFLQAYNFFVEPKQKALLTDFYNQDENNCIQIDAEYTVSPDIDQKDSALSKSDPDWINKWVTSENKICIRKIWKTVGEGQKQTFNPKTSQFEDGGFGGFDTILKRYSPAAIIINAVLTVEDLEKNINEIITKNHIKKLETTYVENYNKVVSGLQQLKQDIAESDDIVAINTKMNAFFTAVFPSFELAIYPLPDEGVDITKTLKSTHGVKVHDQNNTSKDVDLKQNGHGLIRQAFFSFLSTYQNEITGTEKQFLILFEEPELYLHPEAIFSLRKQLYALSKDSPYQILCATHSPLMIDVAEDHSSLVRLVKDETTDTTRTYQVNLNLFNDEEKNRLQMINRLNPHVCEVFFTNGVVLVEGDTEAIVYRELIARFYTKDKFYILNTGSKSNFPFYQKVLSHFGIKHVAVHDADEQFVTKNGRQAPNPMFTLNEKIWDQIEHSNQIQNGIARRFVHYLNFEGAHNYKPDSIKGKPLSAYEFALSLTDKHLDIPCFHFLNDLFKNSEINISQEYLLKKYTPEPSPPSKGK